MYVQSYSGWKERICDWGGALRVLGFRLPAVCVVCVPMYAHSTLKVPSRPEKIVSLSLISPVVEIIGPAWNAKDCRYIVSLT
jgi:hypothetical protein